MPDTIQLPDEAATVAFGRCLAECLQARADGAVILLQGDLGTGKTTLVRAIVRALGYSGRVVSPSYTLMEPYNAGPFHVVHMDLYRLGDPEELEFLGIRDLDPAHQLLLIEWPERGAGMLPAQDLHLRLEDGNGGRGRTLSCLAASDRGAEWWQAVRQAYAANRDSVG